MDGDGPRCCPECGATLHGTPAFCGSCGARTGASGGRRGPEVGDSPVGGRGAARPRRPGAALLGVLVLAIAAVAYVALRDDTGHPDPVPGEVAVPAAPPPATASPTAPSGRQVRVEAPPPPPLPDGWHEQRGERFSIHVPEDWHFTPESFTPDNVAPRDIFALATFEPTELPTPNDPRSWCLPELVGAVGPDDVLVVFFSPTYLAAAPRIPPPFGEVSVDADELEEARAHNEETSAGFCGNPDAMFVAESGAIDEWVYDVWIILGDESPPERLGRAVRAINSYRSPPAGS